MMNRLFQQQFKGKTVLVTGHTGFKGSWLSIWLKELGANVIGYSLAPPTNPSNFALSHLDKKIIHIEGNVCDQSAFKAVLDSHQPEVVFHLAAQPIVLTSYRDPVDTFQSNVMGTVLVLDAIRQLNSVKAFVGVTSDKVYKDQGWYWGYRESDVLGGHDPYSASKAITELVISSYRSSWSQSWRDGERTTNFSGHPVAIASARAGNVIGGGDFADFRILPDFMKACLVGESMEMRNPNSIRPWQHVLEPLSGYLWLAVKLLSQKEHYQQAWNFGPAEREPITCKTLIDHASRSWGADSAYHLSSETVKAHEMKVLRVNWDLAAHQLSWAPSYNWRQAVEETVSWWKKYQSQLKNNDNIDMYDICVHHIRDYVDAAKQQSIAWAIN